MRSAVVRVCLLLWLCAASAWAAEPIKITVAVPGPGTGGYLPIELIPRIGADKAHGAEVRLVFVPGGGVALENLLTNNVDFAVVGLPAAMSARLRDSRVIALAPVNDLPLYALMVREGLRGKVKTVADLKGRVIGVHSNSVTTKTNSHQLVDLVLRENGVSPDSVRTVAVGQRWQSEAAMLATGEADAVMGDEPYASRMEAEKLAFPLLHMGNPEQVKTLPGAGFLRATLIGRRDLVERDPQKAEAMVRIVKHVLAWVAESSTTTITKAIGRAGTTEGEYLQLVLQKYPRQYSRDGKFSTRQLQETELFFHRSQSSDSAARELKLESMVVDRWAGRKN